MLEPVVHDCASLAWGTPTVYIYGALTAEVTGVDERHCRPQVPLIKTIELCSQSLIHAHAASLKLHSSVHPTKHNHVCSGSCYCLLTSGSGI